MKCNKCKKEKRLVGYYKCKRVCQDCYDYVRFKDKQKRDAKKLQGRKQRQKL